MRYASAVVIYFGMTAVECRPELTREDVEKMLQDLTGIKSRFIFPGKHGSSKWATNIRGDDVVKLCNSGRGIVDKLLEGVNIHPDFKEGTTIHFDFDVFSK